MKWLKDWLGWGAGEKIIAVDSGTPLDQQTKKLQRSQFFSYIILLFLLTALLISYASTPDLLNGRERLLREKARLEEEEKALQNDMNGLQQSLAQWKERGKDAALLNQAVPSDPSPDQMVSLIEHLANSINEVHPLSLPESISWREVSASEEGFPDADIGIYQYSLPLVGSYEGVFTFLQSLRKNLRITDIRSLSNLHQDASGIVTSDLTFWSYYLL